MECKNCGFNLQSTHNYCNSCGSKVIRNRLTFQNVWGDFTSQVFNLDNSFLKTLKNLFIQPHRVILDYISGVRKRYMNPVSYFAIAITLSGIMFFILREVYHLNLAQSSFSDKDTPNMEFIFDYQGLLAYLIMPLYALLTWLLFRRKIKYNYTEHLVANAYVIGQASFVQIIIYITILGLFPIKFDLVNFLFLFLTVMYQFYVLARMHQTKFWGILWRALAYLALLLILMTGIGILIVILTILTGEASLQDFAPK